MQGASNGTGAGISRDKQKPQWHLDVQLFWVGVVEGLGAFVIDHEPSSTGNFSIQFISLELWANCEPSLTIPLPGMHPQP